MAMKRTQHDLWWQAIDRELFKREQPRATLGEVEAVRRQTTDPAWAARMIERQRGRPVTLVDYGDGLAVVESDR